MFPVEVSTKIRVPVIDRSHVVRVLMRSLVLLIVTLSGGVTVAAEPLSADALALRILDGEGLYTVTSGMKPISEGYWQSRFPATKETTDEVELTRRTLESLPLGPDLEAGVYVFVKAFDGKRTASAFVAHKPSLRALIERRKDVFESIGVRVSSTPQQVLEKIDRGPGSTRWRAFGLVFGYPEYAVEFFVAAGEKEAATKQFVTRDFVNLPTFTSDQGRFVYAVPKGHVERDEDRELKSKTADIITQYRAWRTVYLDQQKLGSVELLRNWITSSVVVDSPVSTPSICRENRIPVEARIILKRIGQRRFTW